MTMLGYNGGRMIPIFGGTLMLYITDLLLLCRLSLILIYHYNYCLHQNTAHRSI